MTFTDPALLARELIAAHAAREPIPILPSATDAGFDLTAAYAVEAEIVRLRAAAGHRPVGRKVGFANKAMWRVLRLDTVAWAHMYDDTVRYAVESEGAPSFPIGRLYRPKIEPEIVFRLERPLSGNSSSAAEVLEAVEWLALGFEIIDCVFPDWKFQPPDFVASFGLHAALVVGPPMPIASAEIPALVDQLARFKVQLSRDGSVVEEGGGRNCLRSPALCLDELAAALARQPGAASLEAGELVSSGTLTESRLITAGETWTAMVDGLNLPPLTLQVTA